MSSVAVRVWLCMIVLRWMDALISVSGEGPERSASAGLHIIRSLCSISVLSQEKRGPLQVAERRRQRSGEARLLPGSSAEVQRMSHPQT